MKYAEHLFGCMRSYGKLMSFYRGFFPVPRLLRGAFEVMAAGRTSFPLTVDILVTRKCDLYCWMCAWKESGASADKGHGGEMTTGQIRDVIAGVAKYRPVIHLGGGEPFLRPDIREIVAAVKAGGMRCMITTSGHAAGSDAIRSVMAKGLDGIIFSLYGWGALHDKVTGVPGSFERAAGNIRSALAAREKKTRIFVSTLPLPENLEHLGELVGKVREMGVDGVKMEHLNFVTRAEYGTAAQKEGARGFLPFTHVREDHFGVDFAGRLVAACRRLEREFGGYVFIKPYLSEAEMRKWYSSSIRRYYKCFFITHSALVNYNGDILPCHFFPGRVLGNVRNDSMADVWRSEVYDRTRTAVAEIRPAICGRCCKN